MPQIVKSSGFKSDKYGGQSTGVWNSANNCWLVLVVWKGAKVTERLLFVRLSPLDPGDHMLSQKLLVDVGADTLASKIQLVVA
jgi:hypothetical protein